MNKAKLILASASLLIASAFTAHAQQTVETTPNYRAASLYGAQKGDWEFTLGGSGSSNRDFDNSGGGVNASLGYYFTDTTEISIRQTVNYSNPSGGGGAEYDGATFVALDQHFGTGRFRPFVGLNIGRFYGENTNETWAAGIEAGAKFYVQPKTFLFALVDYAWVFEDSNTATDNFDDGAFLWTVGIGFNF